MTNIANRLKRFVGIDGEFDLDVRHTYFALRTAVGTIGLLLPLVLVGWGWRHGIKWSEMQSLSAFYWLSQTPPDAVDPLRDWFVGSLIAVGICLVIYRGYGNLENWLLNFAGLAAVVVALHPMPWSTPLHTDPLNIHYSAAVIFFVLIAATIWFCARDTLVAVSDRGVRVRWEWIYRAFAVAMVLVPFSPLVVPENIHRTIAIEWAGVWVFGSYWFAKTHELSSVSMVEPPSGPPPRVRRIGGRLEIVGSS